MWNDGKKRRLSIPRLLLTVTVLIGITMGVIFRHELLTKAFNAPLKEGDRFFAAYVDATLTPRYDFEKYKGNVVLGFIVDGPKEGADPSWGGEYTLEQAAVELDLDRRIALLRRRGYDATVSFGGAINQELALAATSENDLKEAYLQVIQRYDLGMIDLDLEEAGLTDQAAAKIRNLALKDLQQERQKQGKTLDIWLTLPVTTAGLTDTGTKIIQDLLAVGVELAGVNIMTMNFGEETKKSLSEQGIAALKKTHRQLKILYRQQKIYLSDQALWGKLGATAMIGVNDIKGEVFTLKDAQVLNQFAQDVQLQRLSMWSANRDRASNPNSIGALGISPYYSGLEQQDNDFAQLLQPGFTAGMVQGQKETVSDLTLEELETADDPAKSPYDIWQEDQAYLAGARVVWRHNVYQAKWWTKGEAPDTPALQETTLPWELLGPVLPGETPVAWPRLPADHYPQWDAAKVYQEGDLVMYQGNPYEAKWWNQNEDPEKSNASENGGAWRGLTMTEIREILAD